MFIKAIHAHSCFKMPINIKEIIIIIYIKPKKRLFNFWFISFQMFQCIYFIFLNIKFSLYWLLIKNYLIDVFICTCVVVCAHEFSAHEGHKRVLDHIEAIYEQFWLLPWGLSSWVLYKSTLCTANYWAMLFHRYPVTYFCFLNYVIEIVL